MIFGLLVEVNFKIEQDVRFIPPIIKKIKSILFILLRFKLELNLRLLFSFIYDK